MIPLPVALPLACLAISATMAAAVVARDPGLRIHRALGALLVSTAWWSGCEVVWQLQDDAEAVRAIVRMSSLGWMALGPTVLFIFSEIAGRPRILSRVAFPISVLCAFLGVGIYFWLPVMEPVHVERWGWGYTLEPMFLVPYSIAVSAPTAVLGLWPHFHPLASASGGERRVSGMLFASVCIALAVTMVSEVALPLMGVQALHLGTVSITAVAVVSAVQLNRYGYSLLSPVAFAREILSTLGDGVAFLYADGKVRFANRALEELAGAEPGGLHGRPADALLPGLFDRKAAGGEPEERELVTCAGDRLPVAVVTLRIGSPPIQALLVRDLREVWSLRDRAVTGGRLATVGELSAAIAHEIQTPADHVSEELRDFRRAWAEAARALPAGDPLAAELAEHRELIEESLEGVERVAAIARAVGSFEGSGPPERDAEDLNAIVEKALAEVEGELPPGAPRVERTFGELPPVNCSAREIGQVVSNLVRNALDATGGRGPVRVRTGIHEAEAWIEVADGGVGIAPEVRDRIFDPFFTTKPAGEGIGLGLPLSFHVVERHGGELRHESEPGVGTRFEVRLPIL